jgi:hypothetical protein
VLSAANLGWIAPQSNQAFRELQAAIANVNLGPHGNWAVTPKGLAERTVPELFALPQSIRHGYARVLQTLNTRAAYVLMVPFCLLLGAQARRLSRARGWRSGSAPIAWFGTAVVCGGAITTSRTAYRVLFHQPSALSEMFLVLQAWAVPAAAALTAIVLARVATRCEHRPGKDTLFVR